MYLLSILTFIESILSESLNDLNSIARLSPMRNLDVLSGLINLKICFEFLAVVQNF